MPHVPAVRLPIEPKGLQSTNPADGYQIMRGWQDRAFDALQSSHHWILNAPMASGKTFLICALGANWLRTTPDLRVIIAVPQLMIAPGFRHNNFELPDGTRTTWKIEVDLTHESAKNSTAHLLQFMKGGTSRTLLCTHATLARVFQKEPEAFKNVLVAIDEAHHVSEQANQLGHCRHQKLPTTSPY